MPPLAAAPAAACPPVFCPDVAWSWQALARLAPSPLSNLGGAPSRRCCPGPCARWGVDAGFKRGVSPVRSKHRVRPHDNMCPCVWLRAALFPHSCSAHQHQQSIHKKLSRRAFHSTTSIESGGIIRLGFLLFGFGGAVCFGSLRAKFSPGLVSSSLKSKALFNATQGVSRPVVKSAAAGWHPC